MGNSVEVLKPKNRSTVGCSNLTSGPGYLSKENEASVSKRRVHPRIHFSSVYKSHGIEAT